MRDITGRGVDLWRTFTRTSFAAPEFLGADAALIAEGELWVWGSATARSASWARDLLMRGTAARARPFSREELRYAVTRGSEVVVVWPEASETLYVAPDGSVLRMLTEGIRAADYDAFIRGARTPIGEFGRPPADPPGTVDRYSRANIPVLAEELAARSRISVLQRLAGTLLEIGDAEIQWLICEEDGDLVAYRAERGVHRELARSRNPAVVAEALEKGLLRS